MIEKHIVLEDIDPVIFYGVNNANMQMIKALYPKLRIVARGNVIKVMGDEEEMCAFEESILALEKHCAQYNSLKEEVILDIVKGRKPQVEKTGDTIVFSVTGKPIVPRSPNQLKLVQEYEKNDMLFAIGPAGSGKTYTAIALAVRSLKNKEIKKIILSRPAVEAGEKLGFLPGDMKDKIDPYLQPLYDALQDMIPAAKLKEYMELNVIQIAPLAFMRGRTLNDAVVILDEAQNTTTQQIKMFLTRMGMNTKKGRAENGRSSGGYSGNEKAAPLRQPDHVCDSCGYGFQAALHGLRQGIHGAAKQDRTANQTDSERSPRIVTYRSACRYIS